MLDGVSYAQSFTQSFTQCAIISAIGGVEVMHLMSNMKKDQKAGKTEDARVTKYLDMFMESWDYAQQNYHQRWERNWKLYHNIRTKTNYPSQIYSFTPMVSSTVNTTVASLFSGNPSIRYIPNHEGQEADTEVLNDIYQDFARRDGWALKNKVNGRQGVITGNYCAYYEWMPDKDGGYVHKIIVPVRDMIIDPQATNPDDWRYVGRRFFASKKELKQAKIYDFNTKKMTPRYKNLDKLVKGGGESDRMSDKAEKDQALGATAPGQADMVELIEIWTRKEVVVIAGRTTIIEEHENPHYALEKAKFEKRKAEYELNRIYAANMGEILPEFGEEFDEAHAGLLPFAHGCEYQDVSLVYGTSDVDIIADQQEMLNMITDLNIQAELYTLNPERRIDPKYADALDDLDPAPGKVYPVPAGMIEWQNPAPVPQAAFMERQNIKGEIREASSVSEISKGITATDSTTATEIKAMLGQADVRIREKAQNLADGFYFQEAKICLKLLQLYADDTYIVRKVSEAGSDFTEVDMTKFLGEYTPMVSLDVQRKLEQSEKQEAYMNAYQIIIADPTNNLVEAKRIMYKKMMPELSEDDINAIIEPQDAPQAPVSPMQGENEQLAMMNAEAPLEAQNDQEMMM